MACDLGTRGRLGALYWHRRGTRGICAQRDCLCEVLDRACILIACHPYPPPTTGARGHSPRTWATAQAAARTSPGMLIRSPARPTLLWRLVLPGPLAGRARTGL